MHTPASISDVRVNIGYTKSIVHHNDRSKERHSSLGHYATARLEIKHRRLQILSLHFTEIAMTDA